MNIEQHANALANSTSSVNENELNWTNILNPEVDDSAYFEVANLIVEPENVEDEYYEWMDNDPENWAGFVAANCGEMWGELAKVVNKYGY